MADSIRRGDVWVTQLDPIRGREQAGTRPALVMSVDQFNDSGADLVIVAPITSRDKGIRSHVRVEAPEAGLTLTSFIKPEDLRSVSTDRLLRRMGTVEALTIEAVEDRLRIILGLC